jgi:hypothetical protein
MGNDPHVTKAAELLRLDLMPSPADVKAGKVASLCSFNCSWLITLVGPVEYRYQHCEFFAESGFLKC